MTNSAKIAGVLLFSGLALVRGAAAVSAGEAASFTVAPSKGIALTVGAKRAIGYYVADAGKACNLTLMLADSYNETAKEQSEAIRVNVKIDAGSSARVETFQSHALQFSCAADASSLTVLPVERVAYNASAK